MVTAVRVIAAAESVIEDYLLTTDLPSHTSTVLPLESYPSLLSPASDSAILTPDPLYSSSTRS